MKANVIDKKDTCVYLHKKPNDEVFYVGIGNKSRPFWKFRRNPHWNNIVNKYPNYKIEIIHDNLDWNTACDIEKKLISEYKRQCDGGMLTNITIGGDGTKGRFVSDITKEILRQKSLGNKNCIGFKHSEEAKKNMSLAHLGKILPNEVKLKMSLVHKGRLGRETDKINVTKAHEKNLGRIQTQEEKDKRAKKLNKQIIVNGIVFESIKKCSEILKINRSTLTNKLLNENNKNFEYAN
jgi:hypothetical protein